MKIVLEKFFSFDLLKNFYYKENVLNSSFVEVLSQRLKEEFFFERDFLALFYFLITENKRETKEKELNNLVNFSSLLLIFKYHLFLDNFDMKDKKSKTLFARSDILVVDRLKQFHEDFPLDFFFEFLDTLGLSFESSFSHQALLKGNKYLDPYFLLLFKSLYFFDEKRDIKKLIIYGDFIKDVYWRLMKGEQLSLNIPQYLSLDLIDSVVLKEVIVYLRGVA